MIGSITKEDLLLEQAGLTREKQSQETIEAAGGIVCPFLINTPRVTTLHNDLRSDRTVNTGYEVDNDVMVSKTMFGKCVAHRCMAFDEATLTCKLIDKR